MTLAKLREGAPDYPENEPIPQPKWKVSIACGKEGGGAFGYGPTLDIALDRAARAGWTPVRQYIVEIVWDRHWGRGAIPDRVCKMDVKRGHGSWAQQVVECVIDSLSIVPKEGA